MLSQALFRGTVAIGLGTTAPGFCSRGERLGSALNTTRKSVDFIAKELSQGIGGLEIAKLNFRGKEGVHLNQPKSVLLQATWGW